MSAPEMSDSDRVELGYLRAIVEIGSIIGATIGDFSRPSDIDRDEVPASVIAAGQTAMQTLATAVGILDPTMPSMITDADECLAAWSDES
jgi:hypothetical protein